MKIFRICWVVASALLLVVSFVYAESDRDERCLQTPVNGSCKAMMERFFFDRKTGKCTPYFYDGCGRVVPFVSLEECQASCEVLRKKRPGSSVWYDAVEDDPRYSKIFAEIDSEVRRMLASEPLIGHRGSIHTIWSTKKSLLKNKYGINWRTPAELNPHIMFD